jgi:hypothetical protein
VSQPDRRCQGARRRLRFSRRFALQVRRAVDVLIDKDRVSVRIDQHQTGRAGGGFIRLGIEREPFGFKALLNLPNIAELLERGGLRSNVQLRKLSRAGAQLRMS